MKYDTLKGKRVFVFHQGWRTLKVVRVHAGPRKGLDHVRCATPGYGAGGLDWSGPLVTVPGRSLMQPGAGVIYRGKVQPIGGGA